MKTTWGKWIYLSERHIFVHENGSVISDSFLEDVERFVTPELRERNIQEHLDHMEHILIEQKEERYETIHTE